MGHFSSCSSEWKAAEGGGGSSPARPRVVPGYSEYHHHGLLKALPRLDTSEAQARIFNSAHRVWRPQLSLVEIPSLL